MFRWKYVGKQERKSLTLLTRVAVQRMCKRKDEIINYFLCNAVVFGEVVYKHLDQKVQNIKKSIHTFGSTNKEIEKHISQCN